MKYIFFAFTLLVLPFSFSQAQIGASLVENGASIKVEPAYPEPFTTITANLDDYSLASRVSGIVWRVNGASVPEAANQRTISLTTKGAGEETAIEAVLTLAGGGSQIIRKTIEPVYLDIIVEPQTKTPSFYLGRGLPSIGSTINVTALLNGSTNDFDSYLYTWRVNNQVVEGGAVRGNNRVSLTVPLGKVFLVTLDISTLAGGTIMRRTIELPSVEPSINFYERSTLYGTSNKAFSSFNMTGESVTIKAEPYNLDIRTYNDPEYLEWKLNGVRTTTPTGNPYEITFSRSETYLTGSTQASLHIRNLTQLLQGAEGGFEINF